MVVGLVFFRYQAVRWLASTGAGFEPLESGRGLGPPQCLHVPRVYASSVVVGLVTRSTTSTTRTTAARAYQVLGHDRTHRIQS